MSNTGWILTVASAFFILQGCGAKWSVSEQRFFKYQNKDIRIAGVVELTEKGKRPLNSDNGPQLEARFYTDEYLTVIHEANMRVGAELEKQGMIGKREIFKLPITDVRLGGTSNSYPKICAEIRVDSSNIEKWTPLGCVGENDTPSESETGDIGRDPVTP